MAGLTSIRGRRVLLVASTGGHLAELDALARSMQPSPDSLWVTFDSKQSRSLLSDRPHHFIGYIAPRDLGGTIRAVPAFRRLLRSGGFEAVVSTGAAVAVAALTVARALRVPAFYVESLSRTTAPSLTGRLLQRVPGVELRTQHRSASTSRWQYEWSLLDELVPVLDAQDKELSRVFVTLGTIKPYRFDSLVDSVVRALPRAAEVTWQLGATDRSDLPGRVVRELPSRQMFDAMRSADLVVSHAGVGSVMSILSSGTPALIVPRRRERGEHVDNHQVDFADQLRRIGICAVAEVPDVDLSVLQDALTVRAKVCPGS